MRPSDRLKGVAVVAAEDTRHSKPLLHHAGSHAELISFHEHSSDRALERILRILTDGRDVALITDAGTPVISDPGVALVAAARGRGIQVVTIPGPNAVAADRKSTRLNSSHSQISYAVFCLKKKKITI